MSLKLFLILSIAHVCYSTTIQCSTRQCKKKTLNCADNADCIVNCIGVESCQQATINCPENANCRINCKQDKSCYGAKLKCPCSGQCDISLECYQNPEANWQVCTGMDLDTGADNFNYGCNKLLIADGDCPSTSGWGNKGSCSGLDDDDIPVLGAMCTKDTDCSASALIALGVPCSGGDCFCNKNSNCCKKIGINIYCWGYAAMGIEEYQETGKSPSYAYVPFVAIAVCLIVMIVAFICYRKRKKNKDTMRHMEEVKDEEEMEIECDMEPQETEPITVTN